MGDFLKTVWADPFYQKLVLTLGILLLQIVARRLVLKLVDSLTSPESPSVYTLRKVAGFVLNFVAVLLIFGVWVQRLTDLSVALGIFGAGLAFALQEIIGSFAGWLTIVIGRPFTIGDRVETGGIHGDVVDVDVLRTTLMEIGNWLDGAHNTGRIVTISNASIFKEPLFNYSCFHFIWDEIKVPVTYDADWKRAMVILVQAVKESPYYQDLLPVAQEQIQKARKEFAVKVSPLEPRVFVQLTDNWIELGLIYPVDNELRRTFRSEVSQRVLEAFEAEGITVASQTVAIVDFPPLGDGES